MADPIAELTRRRKKKKKKRKKKRRPAQQAPPVAQPPPGPQKHKHITGWDDSAGDGLVREVFEWVDTPPTEPPPPRPLPAPQPPPAPGDYTPHPMGTYQGDFGRVQAKRLLDRAGFGAAPGQALVLSEHTLQAAVHSLTRPSGAAELIGPAPVDDDGDAITPNDEWGHDHLWWLDRMIRTTQPLVERMTLVLHDWFATSNADVSRPQQMIDQSWLFRNGCFGSFLDLTINVTKDPAMLQWLNGDENRRQAPNENYARELMELFTLGADRQSQGAPKDAYTEDDIREAAKALTGWRSDWSDALGAHNFRFDPNRHDNSLKKIFSGPEPGSHWDLNPPTNWNWDDVPRLCIEHPLHASFFVEKLWSYFIPQAPSADTRAALETIYTSNGYAIRPVLEAILMHPDFYLGPPMVKPPVVFLASLLRALGRYVDTEAWVWLGNLAGQQLFWPPNVSGWDDDRWLDTSRMRARWLMITYALDDEYFDPWVDEDDPARYSATETATEALNRALGLWDYPPLRADQDTILKQFADDPWDPPLVANWQQSPGRAMRQNTLQQLIAISPDFQLS